MNIASVWLKGSSTGAVQSPKVTKKAEWEKSLAKIGHWQVDLGQSGKIVTLSPETQTKHRFKNRAPSSDLFMAHTPAPIIYPIISIHTRPSSMLRSLSRTPDRQTCHKALEATQNNYSNSSKQYPTNLRPSKHL